MSTKQRRRIVLSGLQSKTRTRKFPLLNPNDLQDSHLQSSDNMSAVCKLERHVPLAKVNKQKRAPHKPLSAKILEPKIVLNKVTELDSVSPTANRKRTLRSSSLLVGKCATTPNDRPNHDMPLLDDSFHEDRGLEDSLQIDAEDELIDFIDKEIMEKPHDSLHSSTKMQNSDPSINEFNFDFLNSENENHFPVSSLSIRTQAFPSYSSGQDNSSMDCARKNMRALLPIIQQDSIVPISPIVDCIPNTTHTFVQLTNANRNTVEPEMNSGDINTPHHAMAFETTTENALTYTVQNDLTPLVYHILPGEFISNVAPALGSGQYISTDATCLGPEEYIANDASSITEGNTVYDLMTPVVTTDNVPTGFVDPQNADDLLQRAMRATFDVDAHTDVVAMSICSSLVDDHAAESAEPDGDSQASFNDFKEKMCRKFKIVDSMVELQKCNGEEGGRKLRRRRKATNYNENQPSSSPNPQSRLATRQTDSPKKAVRRGKSICAHRPNDDDTLLEESNNNQNESAKSIPVKVHKKRKPAKKRDEDPVKGMVNSKKPIILKIKRLFNASIEDDLERRQGSTHYNLNDSWQIESSGKPLLDDDISLPMDCEEDALRLANYIDGNEDTTLNRNNDILLETPQKSNSPSANRCSPALTNFQDTSTPTENPVTPSKARPLTPTDVAPQTELLPTDSTIVLNDNHSIPIEKPPTPSTTCQLTSTCVAHQAELLPTNTTSFVLNDDNVATTIAPNILLPVPNLHQSTEYVYSIDGALDLSIRIAHNNNFEPSIPLHRNACSSYSGLQVNDLTKICFNAEHRGPIDLSIKSRNRANDVEMRSKATQTSAHPSVKEYLTDAVLNGKRKRDEFQAEDEQAGKRVRTESGMQPMVAIAETDEEIDILRIDDVQPSPADEWTPSVYRHISIDPPTAHRQNLHVQFSNSPTTIESFIETPASIEQPIAMRKNFHVQFSNSTTAALHVITTPSQSSDAHSATFVSSKIPTLRPGSLTKTVEFRCEDHDANEPGPIVTFDASSLSKPTKSFASADCNDVSLHNINWSSVAPLNEDLNYEDNSFDDDALSIFAPSIRTPSPELRSADNQYYQYVENRSDEPSPKTMCPNQKLNDLRMRLNAKQSTSLAATLPILQSLPTNIPKSDRVLITSSFKIPKLQDTKNTNSIGLPDASTLCGVVKPNVNTVNDVEMAKIRSFFGYLCIPYLRNRCNVPNCKYSHTLLDPQVIYKKLQQKSVDFAVNAYNGFVLRHSKSFLHYFEIFCRRFADLLKTTQITEMLQHLEGFVPPPFGYYWHVVDALVRCGSTRVNAIKTIVTTSKLRSHDGISEQVEMMVRSSDCVQFIGELTAIAELDHYRFQPRHVNLLMDVTLATRNPQMVRVMDAIIKAMPNSNRIVGSLRLEQFFLIAKELASPRIIVVPK